MTASMDTVIAQVRSIEAQLLDHGWVVANSIGELCTPGLQLWFGAVYVHGEYTVHASHREKGAGTPRGNIRVRVTPTLVTNHPFIGQTLADDLVRAHLELRQHGFSSVLWPPPVWAEFSNEGVVDHR